MLWWYCRSSSGGRGTPERQWVRLVAIVGAMYLTQAAIAQCPRAMPAAADPGPEAVVAPPPYNQLRYEEDYTYLQNPARRGDVFDTVKYVPFGGVEGRYLSLGGEARPFFEWFRNEDW